LEPKEFSEFKELLQGVILILIDEFSNQAPWHLAKFSTECQRATGNFDLPFGGIPVIMGGDLQQMGPVKAGKSLAEGILDMCLNVWAPDT
jgi:uracil phosphoribosyltransferase